MNISIFDVVGPIMIGPSSSHTAGAVRLARVAHIIAGDNIRHVSFGLHGSFARTYKGHGTDLALVAGILGLNEDDERIVHAFELAEHSGITFDFHEIQLAGMHENSVKIVFYKRDGTSISITGSSIGGGLVILKSINDYNLDISDKNSTLIVILEDKKGVISNITRILAEFNINIGAMQVIRHTKGLEACCIIEIDDILSDTVVDRITTVEYVKEAHYISI